MAVPGPLRTPPRELGPTASVTRHGQGRALEGVQKTDCCWLNRSPLSWLPCPAPPQRSCFFGQYKGGGSASEAGSSPCSSDPPLGGGVASHCLPSAEGKGSLPPLSAAHLSTPTQGCLAGEAPTVTSGRANLWGGHGVRGLCGGGVGAGGKLFVTRSPSRGGGSSQTENSVLGEGLNPVQGWTFYFHMKLFLFQKQCTINN